MSVVTVFDLTSILSDINITALALFWWFAWKFFTFGQGPQVGTVVPRTASLVTWSMGEASLSFLQRKIHDTWESLSALLWLVGRWMMIKWGFYFYFLWCIFSCFCTPLVYCNLSPEFRDDIKACFSLWKWSQCFCWGENIGTYYSDIFWCRSLLLIFLNACLVYFLFQLVEFKIFFNSMFCD